MLGHKKKREKIDQKIENDEDKDNDKENQKDKNTKTKEKDKNQNFLMKLYQILETQELSKIIEWGDNGKFFKVKNITEFTEKVLPKFFKHNNFASFVRQVLIVPMPQFIFLINYLIFSIHLNLFS